MNKITRRSVIAAAPGALALGYLPLPALAKGKYDTGTTDTEIKIGNTSPYSGPASSTGRSARSRPPSST